MQLDNSVRNILKSIIRRLGPGIIDDVPRLERDMCDRFGEQQPEYNLLLSALLGSIPHRLISAESLVIPVEESIRRLAGELTKRNAIIPAAACWAVESWALALNLISEPLFPPVDDLLAFNEVYNGPKRVATSSKPAATRHRTAPDFSVLEEKREEKKIISLEEVITGVAEPFVPLLNSIDEQLQDTNPEWVREFLLKSNEKIPFWLSTISNFTSAKWLTELFGYDTDLTRLGLSAGFLKDDLSWHSELSMRYEAGVARVFILHGNINDYVFDPGLGYIPLVDFLKEQNANRQVVYLYSLAQGIQEYKDGAATDAPPPTEREETPNLWLKVRHDLKRLDEVVRNKHQRGAVIIIQYLNKLFPPDTRELEREFFQEMILRWAIEDEVLKSNNLVIMTTPSINDIHQDLRFTANKVDVIEIPRPNRKERLKFLIALYAINQYGLPHRGRNRTFPYPLQFGKGFTPVPITEALEQLADITSGLNRMGLEDLTLRAQVEQTGLLTRDYVNRHKKTLLGSESAGLLEIIEPRFGFEAVGGIRPILDRLQNICKALKSADSLLRQTVPMGILFLGPPGTGKSFVAEALAKESGLSFAKLGNIREMWVGQSERNLSFILNLLRSMEPIIVFIDEIDQSEGRRSEGGDSGVGGRIFSKLLEFMSDTSLRGRILWIAASNRPDKIDEAMIRSGRFDLKLPFFLPDFEDRIQIFGAIIKSKEIPIDPNLNWESLAEKSDFFSGADIELVINEALRVAIERANGATVAVNQNDFEKVLRGYQERDKADLQRKERKILEHIPFTEFWPDRYKEAPPNPEQAK